MSVGLTSFTFKRGDSFAARVRFRPQQDGLQNLLGASITSKVKDHRNSYFNLDCTLSGDGLEILVSASSYVTDDFSLGVAKWDVRIDLGATVIHTPTIQFVVVDEVTQAPNPVP